MLTSFLNFNGRIGRGTWWLVGLVLQPMLMFGGAGLFLAMPGATTLILGSVLVLISAWIGICSSIKRYHDRGKSGFWVFICFVPIVGTIWMFIELGFIPGEEGVNDFGPPPGSLATHSSADGPDVSGKLSKLDDAYFQEYAAKLAAQNAVQSQSNAAPRATFGKRA